MKLFMHLAIGFIFGYCVAHLETDYNKPLVPVGNMHKAVPPTDDISKSCRVVTHSDSTGYAYWSCEKNDK